VSESDFRLRELERRVGINEGIIRDIPVMAENIKTIKEDLADARDETRSMRKAFYALAGSIMSASIIALITVDKFFSS
jgi:ribosomal protein S6